MLNEPRCPLVKLGLELALGPGPARVQALELQAQALEQAQTLVQVAELAQQEPQVQALMQVAELARLEPQVQLELEPRLQRSHPKPQLHHHRCKAPDRSQEPQLELLQTQVHPKALDTTPRVLVLVLVLVLALELQVAVLAQAPEPERVQGLAAQLAQELEQPVQQELLAQELEPEPGLHVFLERLPLRQGSIQHI